MWWTLLHPLWKTEPFRDAHFPPGVGNPCPRWLLSCTFDLFLWFSTADRNKWVIPKLRQNLRKVNTVQVPSSFFFLPEIICLIIYIEQRDSLNKCVTFFLNFPTAALSDDLYLFRPELGPRLVSLSQSFQRLPITQDLKVPVLSAVTILPTVPVKIW